jgi:Tol biopolymer transport system component
MANTTRNLTGFLCKFVDHEEFLRDESGEIMRKQKGFCLTKIVLCLVLGTILFALLSCNRDQSNTYRAASLGISADDYYPSWSPDGTRIVFFSDRDGNYEIYTMNPDGSEQTRLTENPANDVRPCWSPDGTRIVFGSERDGNEEIYIMNSDGSNETRLTENPDADMSPSWSPDGTRIVFVSDRGGNQEIYTIKIDGSSLTRLTENPADDRYPSWSPDGLKIAFHSMRDGNREIYVMNKDGSNQTRLTDNPANDGVPFWSPDGQKISFITDRDGNREIYVMNTDGSNQTRLTDNPAVDMSPSWSPDGTRIVFVSDRDGNREIYTVKTDGSNPTRLTNEPAKDVAPSWSPDGRKIVFVSERDFIHEVYVMDADGSNTVRLTHNAPVNATSGLAPVPQSELNLDEIPYRIVFQSYRETDGKENWEICLMDADGSNLINLTNTPEIDEEYPHASPDGRLVCFMATEGKDQESKSRNVYIMNIDGTGRAKIAENSFLPCWSADRSYIAYLPGEYPRYDPDVRANKGLEIFDLETKIAKRHPNEKISHLGQLCWSPDGKWLIGAGPIPITAYKADDKTQMYLQAPGCTPDISPDGKWLAWNGSDFSLNIGALDLDSPQSNVTDHRMKVACERAYWIYHADWSPDQKYLAFTYGFDDGGKQESEKEPWSHVCICDLKTGKWTQITTDGKYNEEPDWVPLQIK